jgi:hypothetical protein
LFTALNLLPSDFNNGAGEQAQLATQHHKLGRHRPDRRDIVLAEISNRLEVRRQPSRLNPLRPVAILAGD